MAALTVEKLNFSYPEESSFALKDISVSFLNGSFTLITGATGSGKSTLLRHLKKGLAPHGIRSGKIYLDGEDTDDYPPRVTAQKIGYVSQEPDNQFVTHSVREELCFGLKNLGIPEEEIFRRVGETAGFFGLSHLLDRADSTLSGGEKQRVNLAAVMALRPEILILDEPTAQLDPVAAAEFLEILYRLNRDFALTVILSEHRSEDVFAYAGRVVCMEEGQIIFDGTPGEAARRAAAGESVVPAGLMLPAAARLFKALKREGEIPLTVRAGIEALKNASLTACPQAHAAAESLAKNEPPAVRLKEVFFRYGKNAPDILSGADFTARKGEVTCVLGGNGSGKSTALSVMSGLLKPYAGTVEIHGKNIKSYKPAQLYGKILSGLTQNPSLIFTRDTVSEELGEMTANAADIDRAVSVLGIRDILQKHPFDLSGGQKQKAAFAKLLLCNSEILILDEPSKGMDAAFKNTFAALLKELAKQGKAVILAAHDVEFAAYASDVCCLCFGGGISKPEPARAFFSGNYFYAPAISRIARALGLNGVLTVEEFMEKTEAKPVERQA